VPAAAAAPCRYLWGHPPHSVGGARTGSHRLVRRTAGGPPPIHWRQRRHHSPPVSPGATRETAPPVSCAVHLVAGSTTSPVLTQIAAPYDKILIVCASFIFDLNTQFDSAHRDLSYEAISTSI